MYDFEYDSENRIEHKCPCCGYEVELEWEGCNLVKVKGDKSFVRIKSSREETMNFKTDVLKHNNWGMLDYENVMLLGCPECGCVSFKFD